MRDDGHTQLTDADVQYYRGLADALITSFRAVGLNPKEALYALTFTSILIADENGIELKEISDGILKFYKERLL